MNTIVMNLLQLAVTEYTQPCTGVAGDYETSVAGLHKVGGPLEAAAAPHVAFGLDLNEGARRRSARFVYVHGQSTSRLSLRVRGGMSTIDYTYSVSPGHGRASRFVLGRGINDSFLQLALTGGSDPFVIDRLEFVDDLSTTRRL